MRSVIATAIVILLSAPCSAAEPLKWVKKPELTFDEKAGKLYPTFEL